ncbi:hypothetical protein F2Q69_00039867 [Brassica cretica]|uniref:Uncharacterized protein n=1 Tax=Brassica cretica TaxID=69181 RepID=A0A8S9NA71_BRACR|nr:hypothetical protein F2Q69_00039867 [Brassica cretica]
MVLKTTRKKPATALCSLSFHGSRCGTTVKSTQVPPKKSGLNSSSTSLKVLKKQPKVNKEENVNVKDEERRRLKKKKNRAMEEEGSSER